MDNDTKMSEVLAKMEGLASRMETSQHIQEKQLKMYKEMMDNSIQINRERLDMHEKRWSNVRGVVIGIASLLLVYVATSSSMIISRPTEKELKESYLSKKEAIGGFGVVVDDTYDILERKKVITHEESREARGYTSIEVLREIDPPYRTRSAQKVK